MAHLQSDRVAFTPATDIDPFTMPREILDPTEALMPLCSLEPADGVLPAWAPSRTIFRRAADGKLIFVEVDGDKAVQVGAAVTYAEAGELALAVLSDDDVARSLTVTPALQMLAVAYLAARAAAERRSRADQLPIAARGA